MSEWISVEDRLPKIGQPVGVCRSGNRPHVGCIHFKCEKIVNRKRFWEGSISEFYAEPTHWMPLPEPPKCTTK